MAFDRAREIGHLVRGIAEREHLGHRIEWQRGAGRVVAQVERRDDAKMPRDRLRREVEVADGIAEHVVRPPGALGGRIDRHGGLQQAKVVAVAGADHQPVRPRAHRIQIAVLSGMNDANVGQIKSDHVKQIEQDNDRDGDSDQPEQNAAHGLGSLTLQVSAQRPTRAADCY